MLRRLRVLFDKSAFILIVPALLILFLISPAMAKTMVEWSAFAFVLSGAAVIISRLIFPQIHLTTLIKKAETDSRSAAIVAGSLIIFVSVLIYSLAFWAKA